MNNGFLSESKKTTLRCKQKKATSAQPGNCVLSEADKKNRALHITVLSQQVDVAVYFYFKANQLFRQCLDCCSRQS